VIRFDDTSGSGGTEACVALPDGTITFYGPANWMVPEDRRCGFCDGPEGVTVMRWHMTGTTLVIASTGATEPCRVERGTCPGTMRPSGS